MDWSYGAWIGLIVWIAWWLLLPDWEKIHETLQHGGWLALVLLGIIAVMIWGSIDPQPQRILGIPLPNFWAKTTIVAGLVVIMLGCGALQQALRSSQQTQA